jgi:hypothetical protein
MGEPPAGGVTVRGIASRGSHPSTLTITHTAMRAPSGSLSCGGNAVGRQHGPSFTDKDTNACVVFGCGSPSESVLVCRTSHQVHSLLWTMRLVRRSTQIRYSFKTDAGTIHFVLKS